MATGKLGLIIKFLVLEVHKVSNFIASEYPIFFRQKYAKQIMYVSEPETLFRLQYVEQFIENDLRMRFSIIH